MKVVVPSTCPLHHLPLNLRPGWWSLVRCTHSHSPDRPASLTLPSALGPSPTPRTLSSSNSLSRPLTVIKSRTRSSAPPTPSRAAFQPSQQKLMNGQPVLGAIHYTDYRILCATEMSIINTKHSGNTNTQPTGRPDKYIHMIQSVKKKEVITQTTSTPKTFLGGASHSGTLRPRNSLVWSISHWHYKGEVKRARRPAGPPQPPQPSLMGCPAVADAGRGGAERLLGFPVPTHSEDSHVPRHSRPVPRRAAVPRHALPRAAPAVPRRGIQW